MTRAVPAGKSSMVRQLARWLGWEQRKVRPGTADTVRVPRRWA